MFYILILIIIILAMGLAMKNEYATSRDIIIDKPKAEVYDYIKILRNQNQYSYYNRKDPDTVKSYSGTDGEVGFTYTFSSKLSTIGSGTQTIVKLVEGESMTCNILFIKPTKLASVAEISLVAIDAQTTKVTWTFTSNYKFPLNIIIYFLDLEKLIGTDIASSLVTLKEKLEV